MSSLYQTGHCARLSKGDCACQGKSQEVSLWRFGICRERFNANYQSGHVASPNEDEDATRRENEALKLRLAETETQLQASNLRIAELQIAGHSRGTSSHSRSSDSSVEIDEIEVRDCIPSWQQARAVHQDPTNGWVISDHLRALVIHDDTHHSPATSARYSAQDFDDHLLISAVIYGWESIREYVEHEPQWIFLSAILDGNLLSDLDKINKLPGLLAVRRLLEVGPIQCCAIYVSNLWPSLCKALPVVMGGSTLCPLIHIRR